ncbi:uncharacterized protein N7484_000112 [Penicillium longicatenatum]|uniref:uncharacterized protein n=1 Tax=Penicillium longicatenatum TaxID=1561947 RepID=UPI00254718E3|nr:uncharacterized protein N7484_000112 [Penicillium longicatenatum]KAJ5660740.1 hypothetical protein N7484_000112 [Penicillium longicatenatum]
MVPVAIRVLDRMPHNKSHKVDRQALKESNDVLITFSTTPSKAAPRTALERTLSEELVGLLQVNVSITDSFFELGGHSLTAIRLVANINSRLGTSLRVGDIFSCKLAVERHNFLRTAFFKYQEQYLQIIHRATNVDFVHKCPGESLESTADLISEEYMSLSQLSGQPLPRFVLLSRSATEHRFLVQLSHAQYDGFSFPLFLSEISSSYSNPSLSLPPATQYSDFIYARSFLDQVAPRAEAGEDIPAPVTAIAVDDLPTLLGVILSTLVNVAFAFMLAEMVNSDELTFLAMNIRDIAVKDAGSIMGSCINWNPIRVHIKPYQTVFDICRRFHEEYAGVSRYSSLDLPDIVANCTNWQVDSRFGVIINHLTGGKDCPLKLQGTETASLGFGTRLQALVRAIAVEDTKLEIQVLTSDRMMSSEGAMAFAALLSRTVKLFSESAHKPLKPLQYSELN